MAHLLSYLTTFVLSCQLNSVLGVDRHIGLILPDDPEGERTYEDAFNFAAMVINNNVLQVRMEGNEMIRLYPIITNRTDLSDNYKLSTAICNVVNEGVLVIVGTSHASSFNTIQSYCQALQIPYILATPPRSTLIDNYHFDVNVGPPYIDAVMKVVANVSHDSNIFYVYDSDDGLWRLQWLYHYFQQQEVTHRIVDAFRVRQISRAYALLRNLDQKDVKDRTIVLDLSSEKAYHAVLEQIIDVGMNRESYHYILANADAMDLNLNQNFFGQFLHGGVKITAFRIVDNTTDTYRKWEQLWRQYRDAYPGLFPLKTGSALMIDTARAIHEAFMQISDWTGETGARRKAKSHSHNTCNLDNSRVSTLGPAIMRHLAKVQFEGLTGTLALQRGRRSEFKVDVYELDYKRPLSKVASWKASDLTADSFETYIPDEIKPNKTQRVTTVLEPPFVMFAEKTNGAPPVGANRNLEGYCIDLVEKLSRMVSFEYSVHITEEYGELNETTFKWNGMIGELIRMERDMAVAPLSITEERERVVDFSKPFMNTGISIMIKKPEKVKPGVFSFMDPLDTKVWLCIAIGFMAVSFVLFFVGRFSPYEWNVIEDSKEKTATTIFSISNTLWFSLGALMQQGSDISPRSFSGRVVGSAWWFFTLIIISSYTANLAAFLTIEKLVSPIDSADDLVEHPTIKYGTKSTGTSWRFFEESTIETYVRMRKAMRDNEDEVLFTDYESGVRKVRESKNDYAFLLESAMNSYYAQQEPCDTMMVGDPLDNKGYGVATYLNYPLRDNINIAVLTLEEEGELIKLQQKWWLDKGQCGAQSSSKESTGNQSALTLSNVSGIFHILIGGLVLAMITSSLEYLIQRKLRMNKKNSAEKKSDRKYRLPLPPPPPPRRACFSSSGERPAGTGPGWENGFGEVAATQERLLSDEADDFKAVDT